MGECPKPGPGPHHSERPQPQRESEANPLAQLLQEQRGGGERSHEELVAIIRKDMATYVAEKKPSRFDPVAWMRERLAYGLTALTLAENPDTNVARQHAPHAQLMMAWDVISQPYYATAHDRGLVDACIRDDARVLGHTITLDPNESKLLDAMTEAVGIPHTYGRVPQEKKDSP